MNVFSCSYDTFCNSMTTDTDICKDFKASFEDMRELIAGLWFRAEKNLYLGAGVCYFQSKTTRKTEIKEEGRL